jgi:hypothetical protein
MCYFPLIIDAAEGEFKAKACNNEIQKTNVFPGLYSGSNSCLFLTNETIIFTIMDDVVEAAVKIKNKKVPQFSKKEVKMSGVI